MVISKFSSILCGWLNKINPRSDEENIVIQYGFELILDNIVKLMFLQLVGFLLGKGWETFIIILSFCTLRLQAGGVHARTNIGCSLSMVLVWFLSLFGSIFIKIKFYFVVVLYMIYFVIIALCAPRSKNINHFTYSSILKKKYKSLIVLTFIMAIAVINNSIRELLVYSVTMEVLTLLPKNNTTVKGE